MNLRLVKHDVFWYFVVDLKRLRSLWKVFERAMVLLVGAGRLEFWLADLDLIVRDSLTIIRWIQTILFVLVLQQLDLPFLYRMRREHRRVSTVVAALLLDLADGYCFIRRRIIQDLRFCRDLGNLLLTSYGYLIHVCTLSWISLYLEQGELGLLIALKRNSFAVLGWLFTDA